MKIAMSNQWFKQGMMLFLAMAGLRTATAQPTPNATVATTVFAESTVQYVAPGGATLTSFTNYVTGYDKVKYNTGGTCSKTYLKFDFTGQNVNTNYLLKLSFPLNAGNGATHVLLWALNQAYPGFTNGNVSPNTTAANPTLSWAGAQANFTNNSGETTYNGMLTSGSPCTATLVGDFTESGTSGSVGSSIPAPWGQYLFNNQLVIVMTASNDLPSYVNSSGGRFPMNAINATFQPLTSGTQPPAISTIAAQTVQSSVSSSAISFSVSDPLDNAATLTNYSISFGNTNISWTATNIVASGPGAGNRTLTFTPVSNLAAGQTASTTVTLVVTDSSGNSASTSFKLTVTPLIPLPVVWFGTNVNYLPPTNRVGTGTVTIPFQVVDTNISASSLVVTGSISAYSTNLSSLAFTSTPGTAPSTNNCTVTINATGSGVGIVNLTIIDPVNLVTNSAVSVAVMILPNGSYAACDLMNYQPSTSYASSGHADLVNASAGLWAARSISGSVNLITTLTPSTMGEVPIGVPLIRGTASGNQNQLRLVGAPFVPGSHKVLFASVTAQWCDVSKYGANPYWPSNSTGGFFEFAADANATGVTMAAVCTVTNAANTSGTDGLFNLALYNGSNSPSVFIAYSETIPDNYNYATDVVPNATPDNIVVSYDVDTGISRLWVNQVNSAAASVNLQDVAVTNLANVSYLVLRQNAGMGQILIEAAAVKVLTKPVPTITGIVKSGSTVQISFTSATGSAGTASVLASATVNGTYSPATATINESPAGSGNFTASVAAGGNQMFYRIQQTGATPTVQFPF